MAKYALHNTSIISGMNWHTWVMEQHAMAQWVWPLQHPCPLNLLLLWKKKTRKSAPKRESKARDLEPVMGKSQIQTTILRMERRAVKDTVPNLLLEIHMNGTGGQGANNLCHYPPCTSKVFLHHQIMLRLACFLFRLPYCCVLVSFLAYWNWITHQFLKQIGISELKITLSDQKLIHMHLFWEGCFCVQVLQDGLAWEEVQWSPTSVWVRGTEYLLTRAQFISPHRGLGWVRVQLKYYCHVLLTFPFLV